MILTDPTGVAHAGEDLGDVPPETLVLPDGRRAALKVSYAARLVPDGHYHYAFAPASDVPSVGDLLLGRVSRLGGHRAIEGRRGQRVPLSRYDYMVGVYGNCYAASLYEGVVPKQIGHCAILCSAAICGAVTARTTTAAPPTTLEVLGYLYDAGGARLNLRRFGLRPHRRPVPRAEPDPTRPTIIILAGSGVSSGKTTAAGALLANLARRGLRVVAAKIAGTATSYDRRYYEARGAVATLDFTDCGLPGTYLCPEDELLHVYRTLYHELRAHSPEVIVLELGDGLLQRETTLLLSHPEVQASIDHLIYAAGDSLAVAAGEWWLASRGYTPLCLVGLVTSSPMALREATTLSRLRYCTREQLAAGDTLLPLIRLPGHEQSIGG